MVTIDNQNQHRHLLDRLNRPTRREVVCGCSAAIAALAGSRFGSLTFADEGISNCDTMVVIFLRGGMDGLSAFPPLEGADRGHYQTARPNLSIPVTGPNAARELGGNWGVHPAGAALQGLYQDGRLALVQACGRSEVNRSHFDAMQIMEMSAPAGQTQGMGWLARHLATASNLPPAAQLSSLAVGDLQPTSLTGNYDTVNFFHPEYFQVSGIGHWLDDELAALRQLYQLHDTWLHDSGRKAFDAMNLVQENMSSDYTPANGASYPETAFGEHMQIVAQMIKLDLGLQVATVDLGGWDTHEGQGNGATGFFAGLFGELANALAALYTDLDEGGSNSPLARTTVVVMSEFGREVRENSDNGTEHGHGNMMMVLGGPVNGGIHGQFPGLHPDAREDGTDVAVTTDYRQVLAEILIRRQGNARLGQIFPSYYGYSPLGVVQGVDLPIDDPSTLFSDDFESGAVNRWS